MPIWIFKEYFLASQNNLAITDGTGSIASLKFLRKLTSCALRLTSLLMLQDQEISVSFSFFTAAVDQGPLKQMDGIATKCSFF